MVVHIRKEQYNLARVYSGSIHVYKSWIALVRYIPYIGNPKHQQSNIQ